MVFVDKLPYDLEIVIMFCIFAKCKEMSSSSDEEWKRLKLGKHNINQYCEDSAQLYHN